MFRSFKPQGPDMVSIKEGPGKKKKKLPVYFTFMYVVVQIHFGNYRTFRTTVKCVLMIYQTNELLMSYQPTDKALG